LKEGLRAVVYVMTMPVKILKKYFPWNLPAGKGWIVLEGKLEF
jgi:hypothetical protein